MTIEHLNKRIDRVKEHNDVRYVIGERILIANLFLAGEINTDQFDDLVERLDEIAREQNKVHEYVETVAAFQKAVYHKALWYDRGDFE